MPGLYAGGLGRTLDLLAATAALVVLSPLLAAIALLLLLGQGPPILFLHQRAGLHGQPFTLLKLRTMRAGPEPDSERLTPIGRFLRRWSLDELPSLWNVVRGDMSLVGPRPLPLEYLPLYSPRQTRRHETLPGLTGWAQIHGRNLLSWEEKFEHDVWYVENASLRLDAKILAITIWKVASGEGISAAGHETMPPFRGSVSATTPHRGPSAQ
jgi:lipopolysaccharide/colanic/teichoic acid biosynthesis glycosyltransferase